MLFGIQFTKRELVWAAVVILFLTLLSSLPYIYGFLAEKPGLYYFGVNYFNSEDVPTYLTWTKQALDGHVLFEQLYAPESQPRILFHPLFFLAGLGGKILHLSLIPTYMVLRVFTAVFFLSCAYLFSSYFFHERSERLFSLGLIGLGTGLSNLFGSMSADLTQIELNNFATIVSTVLAPVGMGIMMLVILLFLRSNVFSTKAFLVIFAVLANALLLIHPYDFLPLACVMGGYAVFQGISRHNWHPLRILLYGVIVSFPGLLWQAFVIYKNVPIALWALFQANVSSTGVLSYALGMGVSLIFALIGVLLIYLYKQERYYVLVIWFLMSLILLFNPISERFQRKMSIGITIPLAILATYGIYNLLTDFTVGRKIWVPKKYVLGVIFFLAISSNIALMRTHLRVISASESRPYFLSAEEINGLRWIEQNVKDGQIILTSPEFGLYVPAFTGKAVVAAKIDQNTFYLEKYRIVYDVLVRIPVHSDPLLNYIKLNSIDYIVIPSELIDYFVLGSDSRPYLKEVFANKEIQIYEVN